MDKDMRKYVGRCARCGEAVDGIGRCPSKNNHDCLKGYYARQFYLLNITQGPQDETDRNLYVKSMQQ